LKSYVCDGDIEALDTWIKPFLWQIIRI